MGGQSLITAFSKGYGPQFDAGCFLFSVWLSCGILNVIMAAFVQKTSDGIEERESSYLHNKLKALARQIFRFQQKGGIGPLTPADSGTESRDSAKESVRWPRR